MCWNKISTISDMQMTPLLTAESEEEFKEPLNEDERG